MRKQRIEATVESYIDLETKLIKLMSGICSNCCKCCNSICCEIKYCVESPSSHWLSIVLNHRNPSFVFDKCNGWLSSEGCRIPYGKPPVCYEFFCSTIKTSYPVEAHQYLKLLGNLVNSIGYRALGNRHLITLTPEEIYAKLNLDKILKRIETAQAVLVECGQYFHSLEVQSK